MDDDNKDCLINQLQLPQENGVSVGVAVSTTNSGGGDGGDGGTLPTIDIVNAAAATYAMEWTNDDALELIEQYRCHTELWNRADPKYKDKLCRFRAWSEIAERFGCSKAEIERKMNVLLTQYRREKHKMLMKLYEGIQPGPSKWYAFKRFDFMEGGAAAILAAAAQHQHQYPHNQQHHQLHQHHHHHNVQHGPNGLGSSSISLGGVGGVGVAGGGVTNRGFAASSSNSHRKMKNRDMKYFGAMGLNLPMLIASSQSMAGWNAAGPFSPPLATDHSQLRAPMPMTFARMTQQQNLATASPADDNKIHIARNPFCGSSSISVGGGTDIKNILRESADTIDDDGNDKDIEDMMMDDQESVATESAASPNSNLTTTTATTTSNPIHRIQSAAMSTTSSTSTATTTTTTSRAHPLDYICQEELDIKQELVDFFQAPHPPAPPDSQRSYSSADENRPGGDSTFDDFAQDLRVTAAAVAAAKGKGIDFSKFVLPPPTRNNNNQHPFSSSRYHHQHHHLHPLHPSTSQMFMSSLLSDDFKSDERMRVSGGSGGEGDNDTKPLTAATVTTPAQATAPAPATNVSAVSESEPKDDCDYVGSNVTLKLRSMDRTQRIIAEKLISEILFFGQFSELEKTAKIHPK